MKLVAFLLLFWQGAKPEPMYISLTTHFHAKLGILSPSIFIKHMLLLLLLLLLLVLQLLNYYQY